MKPYAVMRCDENWLDRGEVLSEHDTESEAEREADQPQPTSDGQIAIYVAQRLPNGEWESRLEARDRREVTPRLRGRPLGSGKGRTAKLNLTLTDAGKLAVKQAAKRAGMSVGEWAEACASRALKSSG